MASHKLKCTSRSYLTLAFEASRKAKLADDPRTAADLESAAADYLKRAQAKLKMERGEAQARFRAAAAGASEPRAVSR